MKRICFFLMLIGIALMDNKANAQQVCNSLNFKDNLQSVKDVNVFKSEDYFNWCSSIIKGDDGLYHLFYSRWPKEHTFYAWLTHSEVAHAVSDSPEGPWEYIETVLSSRGKGHWDAITVHNPKIKCFDGKYYLYYISTNLGDKDYSEQDLIEIATTGSSHPNWNILRPNQRTGVAVANSIKGPWKRMDQPLLEPSKVIKTLTVNPAIDQGKDGKYYLIVKGDKPGERYTRNQAIAISDSPTGPFEIQDKPVIDKMDTEDMSLWYDNKMESFYGLFHAHTYIGLVSSKDGINWEIMKDQEIMKKIIPMSDGSFIKPDRMERPFLYRDNNVPKVLSLAVKKGNDAYIVFVPVKTQ